MKIYQLIYTSVKHSLSDSSKGLSNQSGLRVYSCSEGVSRENIQEILRFSLYPMPKAAEHSRIPCDPAVPDKFPKIFKTLKLADGRYAAIQIVYSGTDFKGDRGNYYTHALIFDDIDSGFFPEQYYNSPLFTTCLTKEQQDTALVKYLPMLEEKRDPELDGRVQRFIQEYRTQMQFLMHRALELMVSDEIRSMCIATKSGEMSAMYLVALKYLLPRDISRYTGISTYNVSLPSDKQFNIVFHAAVKGQSNITPELTRARPNCLYIDMDRVNFHTEKSLPIFDMKYETLLKRYADSRITSVTGFIDWCATYTGETKPGIGAKLLKLQQSAGDRALRARLSEMYSVMDDLNHSEVRFELAKILYDNSEKLPSKEADITVNFVKQCAERMTGGEEYPLSENCAEMTEAQAKIIAGNIRMVMKMLDENYGATPEFNKKSFIEFFAIVKRGANKRTWRELFLNDGDMLKTFVTMAAEQTIKGRGIEMFTIPAHWDDRDLSELVAYIDASTEDEVIKRGCLKYIVTYQEENWADYGVEIETHEKSESEEQDDIARVKRMLMKVGYLPFERGRYEHLRADVRADISSSLNPLMLSKVLNSYYSWRMSAGRQTAAHDRALKLRRGLEELRERQRALYDFIIPKLAIEIIEAPGHYHELIVNPDTMPESFWSWFIIGYNRCKPDDSKLLIYHRIYLSNRERLESLPIGAQIKETFKTAI